MKKNFILTVLLIFSTNIFSTHLSRIVRQMVSFNTRFPFMQHNEKCALITLHTSACHAVANKVFSIASNKEALTEENKDYLISLFKNNNVSVNLLVNTPNLVTSIAGFALIYQHIPLLEFLFSQGARPYVEGSTISFAAFALDTQNIILLETLQKYNARLFPNEIRNIKYCFYKDKYPSFFIIDQH